MTPKWMFDLIIAIMQWEEEGHDPNVIFPEVEKSGVYAFRSRDYKSLCHKTWIQLVPESIRIQAQAIKDYHNNENLDS